MLKGLQSGRFELWYAHGIPWTKYHYPCRYCSRRGECNGDNLDQEHKDACSCAYQCDGPCKGFCGYGKRHLLWNAGGMNEIVL